MRYEITSKRIKKALSDNNITAQELANKTGINKASISQYVNGTNRPSNVNAHKMSSVLNVSELYLMGFDVPEEEPTKEEALTPLMAEYIAMLTRNVQLQKFVDKFKQLSDTDQAVVLNLMDSLIANHSN